MTFFLFFIILEGETDVTFVELEKCLSWFQTMTYWNIQDYYYNSMLKTCVLKCNNLLILMLF